MDEVTYSAELWKCMTFEGTTDCEGYQYLEPGSDAPHCVNQKVQGIKTGKSEIVRVSACGNPMRSMGLYEMGD